MMYLLCMSGQSAFKDLKAGCYRNAVDEYSQRRAVTVLQYVQRRVVTVLQYKC